MRSRGFSRMSSAQWPTRLSSAWTPWTGAPFFLPGLLPAGAKSILPWSGPPRQGRSHGLEQGLLAERFGAGRPRHLDQYFRGNLVFPVRRHENYRHVVRLGG